MRAHPDEAALRTRPSPNPLDDFHPAVREWFARDLGPPTPPQERGWPVIRTGKSTLIAAPTGAGKTLAAFLHALDGLFRQGDALGDGTQVLYVSPLRALSNDIQKNLQGPLEAIREIDPDLPEIRVLVRTGDTPQSQRTAMTKRPPHVLVTTPESLYILLTSEGGRGILRGVRTVIVDEIHALLGNKRGSHLFLSLERLEALAESADDPRPLQRIGLSATQKPVEDVARSLVGVGRDCEIVDEGHRRELDMAVEIPESPLESVCSHDTWGEIYQRIADLIREHRTTLVFVNTRKLAERITAQLTKILGEEEVDCHHGSLSKDRRLEAEQRLKEGRLRALVATASLELGIDIGDVDLAVQIGSTRSIATALQRVGRSGHALGRVPRGRFFPLTLDELVEASALLLAARRGELDRTPQPKAPLDILAQQTVAACVPEWWDETDLFQRFRRAWPYRDVGREDFDAAVALHTRGRYALLHRDGVQGRLGATRRARLAAITSGGAIADVADYRVVLEPDGIHVGTLNEDFAVESSAGDIFQLGNTSWRVLKIEPGVVRVADAKGQPPTIPFWLGEAPSRTVELSDRISEVREKGTDPAWLADECGLPEGAVSQLVEYLRAGKAALGAVPTQRCIVAERFFDESGGMQLVIHAPFGGRINRAFGLALRKRFCRGFGFELQAAANEEAIVLSLSTHHSFPLDEVFGYLHPNSAEELLSQAVLTAPMFKARWRWNVTRSLLVERFRGGKPVPAPLQRMRAEDALTDAFPDAVACGETLDAGDIPIPMDHPLVRQTIEDCLHEAMDVDGFVDLLRGLREGRIEKVAVDTPEPSPFARGVLNAGPYAFLDDAPLEERRTQAVIQRRTLDVRTADDLGALDADAVRRVREEAWPDPRDAEEVHEALLWMGYVTVEEGRPWQAWLDDLAAAGRIVREGDRWYASEASRDPKEVLRGRLEALGPVFDDDPVDPVFGDLERDGAILRVRLDGRQAWCERRLLGRIHRYTLDRLRKEIEPVAAAEFLRFLARWQHVDEESMLEGPAGVAAVVTQLAGWEAPSATWERHILRARVRGYRPDWLDDLVLRGQVAWGRLWGSGKSAMKSTPISLLPREDLAAWEALAGPPSAEDLGWPARKVRETLLERGALFPGDLGRVCDMLPSHLDDGLQELIARGHLTNDSFDSLRRLLVPPSRRRSRRRMQAAAGRWSLFRRGGGDPPDAGFVGRALLRRTGVVFRRTIERERLPVPWRDIVRALRRLELRGEIRGGRFVAGFSGEQFALPEAVEQLREVRREAPRPPVTVLSADPLNFAGILTPDEKVPAATRRTVQVG